MRISRRPKTCSRGCRSPWPTTSAIRSRSAAGHAEEHLAQTVRAALEHDLPAETRAVLEGLLRVPELPATLDPDAGADDEI